MLLLLEQGFMLSAQPPKRIGIDLEFRHEHGGRLDDAAELIAGLHGLLAVERRKERPP